MPNPTIDAAIAGSLPPYRFSKVGATMEAAGVLHSLFYTSGTPGAAVAPSPGLAGEVVTNAYGGTLPWQNPPTGHTRGFRVSCTPSSPGTLIGADRLWHNSGIGITTTGAQTVNSVQWPDRCPAAVAPNSNGNFVLVALEASTAIGGGAVANTTLSYTNQSGVAGRTATLSWPATAVAGTFVPFQLQAGDYGIRSIQSLTLGTSYTSGTVHLVAFRQIWSVECPDIAGRVIDISSGAYQRVFDNSALFWLWHPTSTTAATIAGSLQVTQPG